MLCRLFAPPQKTCVKVGRQQRRCYRHGCARGREGGREGERETVYQELRGTSLARILALFQSGADALSITEPGTQTLGKQEEEEEEEEVWEEKKEEGGEQEEQEESRTEAVLTCRQDASESRCFWTQNSSNGLASPCGLAGRRCKVAQTGLGFRV